MELYCGIDLGTTNSTVSVIQTKEKYLRNPIESLRSIPIFQYDEEFNMDKECITLPSYFYCKPDEGKVYTGVYAKKIFSTGNKPMHTFMGVKTRLGGESLVEIPYEKADDSLVLDMTQCSAILLKTIKQSIEQQFDQPIDHLVVTVPAAFNSDERQATKEAIEMAGFEKFHILDEPAATLLYFMNNGDGSLTESGFELNNKKVLIYDIGGGTLDICIASIEYDEDSLDFENIKVQIMSRSKREDLGGNDFDEYLGAYFLTEFEKQTESISNRSREDQNKMISRIVSWAEHYKIQMNDKIKECADKPKKLKKLVMYPEFEVINGQYALGINLDKEMLEEAYFQIVNDTVTQNILRPVKECIDNAQIDSKQDVGLVILTGGMANFYLIEEKLKEYFGEEVPIVTVDTKSSVSKGAAIDAYNASEDNYSLTKMDVQDRLAEDIFIMNNNCFERLISRTEISGKESKGTFLYKIDRDQMTSVPIFLYYGTDVNHKEDFTPIERKLVELPRSFNKGDTITLTWSIDQNRVLRIEMEEIDAVIDVDTNSRSSHIDERKKVIDSLSIN